MQHTHGSCPSGLHDTALAASQQTEEQQEREQQQAWGSFMLQKEEDGLGAGTDEVPHPQSSPPLASTPHNTSASGSTANESRESLLHTLVQGAGPPLPSAQEPPAAPSWQQAPQVQAPAGPALAAGQTAGRAQPGQQGSSPLFLLQKEAERHGCISSGTSSSPVVGAVPQQRGPPAPFSQPPMSASSPHLASPFAPSLLPEGTDAGVSSSLYVKNLPPEATELLLYQHFAPHGAILSCKVLTDQETGRCRGVGFVNYVDSASAVRAAQLVHGTRIAEGRQVHVSLQAPRAVRTAAAAAASAQPSTQPPTQQPQPAQRQAAPLLHSQAPLPVPLQPQPPLTSSLLGMPAHHALRGLTQEGTPLAQPGGGTPHSSVHAAPGPSSLTRGASSSTSGTMLGSPAPSTSRAASGALLQGPPLHPLACFDVLNLPAPAPPQLASQLSATTPHGQLSPLASFHHAQMPYQFMSLQPDEGGYALGLQQPQSCPTFSAGPGDVVEQPQYVFNPVTGLSEPQLRRGGSSGPLRPVQPVQPVQRAMSKPQYSSPLQPQFSAPLQPQFSAPLQAQPLEATPFSQGAFGAFLGTEDPIAALSALSLTPAARQQPPSHPHHHMF